MSRIAILAASAVAVLALTGSANAASFNCYGHLSYTEKTICDNADLSEADSTMASIYFNILNSAPWGSRHAIQRQQIRWLGARDECGANVGCLRTAYHRRIQLLSEAGY